MLRTRRTLLRTSSIKKDADFGWDIPREAVKLLRTAGPLLLARRYFYSQHAQRLSCDICSRKIVLISCLEWKNQACDRNIVGDYWYTKPCVLTGQAWFSIATKV